MRTETSTAIALAMMTLLAAGQPASAAETLSVTGLKDRTIGFALTSAKWGNYQSENGKEECPNGFNEGPREQFKALYPNGGTVAGTQLERESASRYPTAKEDGFPYRLASGKTGIGMNLDGKIGANDFTSPDGEKGIDNQLFRAIGCTRLFRFPDGSFAHFSEMWVRELNVNRILVELTDVDSLVNDNDVTVTMYRGKDSLNMDAAAVNVVPGGSNRIDDRFSKRFTHRLKGKIENGVLVTEPADVSWAWSPWYALPGYYDFKQARFRVTLAPNGESAEGLVAGYADIDTFYQQFVRGWSTHHSSYGSLSQPSLNRELHKLADGIPDKDGANTALSFSLQVRFAQIFIEHPPAKTASVPSDAGERRPSR
ncbi:MAG: hypothetical protein ACYCZX_07820 [Rhodospirillaceae bacterium]